MPVASPEIPNERTEDDFDFIKFLNEVRVRYNLSPTPLTEESPKFKPVDGVNPSVNLAVTEKTEKYEVNTAEFHTYIGEVTTTEEGTRVGVDIDHNINHEYGGNIGIN